MGMKAAQVLGLDLPQEDKRLFTFVETDGCAADGIAVATGCWVGRRTLRVLDYGKVAGTFVDTLTHQAIRVSPHKKARNGIHRYRSDQPDRWHAYLEAYKSMPDEDLLVVQPVTLTVSLEKIISKETARTRCDRCGEEIFNEREVEVNGEVLCRHCAGEIYYSNVQEPISEPLIKSGKNTYH
jgi:formylmethanofuran dehydrogenase subunit E